MQEAEGANNTPLPVVLRNVNLNGESRPSAVILLSDYVRTARFQPQNSLHEIEKALRQLILLCKQELKRSNSHERGLKIGEGIFTFQDYVASLNRSPKLEVVNLNQYLVETLGMDPNTLTSYIISYRSQRTAPEKKNSAISESPTGLILRALNRSEPPLTLTQIAFETGVSYNTLRRQIRELYREGKVRRVGRGRYSRG